MSGLSFDKYGEDVTPTTGVSSRKLLMWAFLGTDVMFFGAFIGTYLVYAGKSISGPTPEEVLNVPITSASTFVLLMSSLAMVMAVYYLKHSHFWRAKIWLGVVILMGLIFLGFQVYEFYSFIVHEHLTPTTNLFGTTFFILTGFHGTHVAIGVLWLIILLVAQFRGSLKTENSFTLEVAGLYWHFVDIVWIVIFTVVYLIQLI